MIYTILCISDESPVKPRRAAPRPAPLRIIDELRGISGGVD
jgi:hypothetical protein